MGYLLCTYKMVTKTEKFYDLAVPLQLFTIEPGLSIQTMGYQLAKLMTLIGLSPERAKQNSPGCSEAKARGEQHAHRV